MTDLHFRATTEFAFSTIATSLGLSGPGVNIDTIAPGSIVQTKAVLDGDGKVVTPATTDPNWHFNVRLDDTFDGNLIKRNFEQGVAKTVASDRRPGVEHSWFSRSFGPQGEVWLIDPAPTTPARIWLGDAAPPVSR